MGIGIFSNNNFIYYKAHLLSEADKIKNHIKLRDYDFFVMDEKSKAHSLIYDIPKDKLRIIYAKENSDFPITNDTYITYCWFSYQRLLDIESTKNHNIYISKLGFCDRIPYKRHINKHGLSDLKKIAENESPRLLWFGKDFKAPRSNNICISDKWKYPIKPNSCARMLELDAIRDSGIEVVKVSFDIMSKSIFDSMIENKCIAILGVDGVSIACFRDHEVAYFLCPYIRMTGLVDYYKYINPYKTFYLCAMDDENSIKNSIDTLRKDILNDNIINIMKRQKILSDRLKGNLMYYRYLEAVLMNEDKFNLEFLKDK